MYDILKSFHKLVLCIYFRCVHLWVRVPYWPPSIVLCLPRIRVKPARRGVKKRVVWGGCRRNLFLRKVCMVLPPIEDLSNYWHFLKDVGVHTKYIGIIRLHSLSLLVIFNKLILVILIWYGVERNYYDYNQRNFNITNRWKMQLKMSEIKLIKI